MSTTFMRRSEAEQNQANDSGATNYAREFRAMGYRALYVAV